MVEPLTIPYMYLVSLMLNSLYMTAFCGRKMFSISESIDDMEAYSKLSDAIYYQILHSTDPALEEVSNHGNQRLSH